MTSTNIMEKISKKYSKLTKTEKKVADFVLSNPQDALRATISDLSQNCGVGETTVFRFCKTLELKGYQDFKLSLALSTSSPAILEKKEDAVIENEDDIKLVARKVLSAYESTLEHSFENINYNVIPTVIDHMLQATSINLFGFGGSGTTAREAQNKLMKILPKITYNFDSHMQLTQAALLDKNDIALIFCNSGITKDCIEIARICHLSNVFTVFITKFPKTPAADYSDIVLLCGANEGPMEGGSIAAKTAQLFLVDILYAEIYRRLGDKALENKRKTAQIITEKMM